MSEVDPRDQGLPADVLEALAHDDLPAAEARLRAIGGWSRGGGWALAEAALETAERDPVAAAAWLHVAAAIVASPDVDAQDDASLLGQIAYAQARVAVQQGDLTGAEALLRQAQDAWRGADDAARLARSRLGMTQVLAMQGRYDEAEAAVTEALAWLTQAEPAPDTLMALARGQRNLATLRVVQDRHAAALPAYADAQATLARLATLLPEEARPELLAEQGHVALNRASAYTFLDRPAQAEAELRTALTLFDEVSDRANRGRAAANLARLYARQGDYAAALEHFDRATSDLQLDGNGDAPDADVADTDDAPAARHLLDELLLEQALAYVALNLLPEAERSLAECEQLFRRAGQPYELAQTHYTRGQLAARRGDWDGALDALRLAADGYRELGNVYWQNRTQVALAQVALLRGDVAGATATLADLPQDVTPDATRDALAWDVSTLAGAWLVRLRVALAQADGDAADLAVTRAAALLATADGVRAATLPHLTLRLLHGRGLLARLRGERPAARAFFAAAADLVEAQRASLPVDELRVAFLDDKMAIYADWVVALLEDPGAGEDAIAAAFAVVERARSRALLERLAATLSGAGEAPVSEEIDTVLEARRATLRAELSALYNRLLGDDDSRHAMLELTHAVTRREAALQSLEWRVAATPALNLPVGLADLQAHLGPQQQAVVYYVAGDEVLAFVIGRDHAHVQRDLCHSQEVVDALADMRFQFGRMEMDAAYRERRAAQLQQGAQTALARLYDCLLAQLRPHLVAEELVFMPYGPLHLTPFHALWDGSRYLVETYDVAYTPSSAVWVHARNARPGLTPERWRFAGFAPHDERIPEAEHEVTEIAAQFVETQRFLGDDASLAALASAVASADVLHLATHGLFRLDNAFFSALKLADGWLDVRAIGRLPGMARLVVLSACESGVGDVRGGDEVIGLARAFLAAGAQAVVASLWNVHDRSAVALMRDFYAVIKVQDAGRVSAALGHAQRAAIGRLMHPYYWAPFVAMG